MYVQQKAISLVTRNRRESEGWNQQSTVLYAMLVVAGLKVFPNVGGVEEVSLAAGEKVTARAPLTLALRGRGLH